MEFCKNNEEDCNKEKNILEIMKKNFTNFEELLSFISLMTAAQVVAVEKKYDLEKQKEFIIDKYDKETAEDIIKYKDQFYLTYLKLMQMELKINDNFDVKKKLFQSLTEFIYSKTGDNFIKHELNKVSIEVLGKKVNESIDVNKKCKKIDNFIMDLLSFKSYIADNEMRYTLNFHFNDKEKLYNKYFIKLLYANLMRKLDPNHIPSKIETRLKVIYSNRKIERYKEILKSRKGKEDQKKIETLISMLSMKNTDSVDFNLRNKIPEEISKDKNVNPYTCDIQKLRYQMDTNIRENKYIFLMDDFHEVYKKVDPKDTESEILFFQYMCLISLVIDMLKIKKNPTGFNKLKNLFLCENKDTIKLKSMSDDLLNKLSHGKPEIEIDVYIRINEEKRTEHTGAVLANDITEIRRLISSQVTSKKNISQKKMREYYINFNSVAQICTYILGKSVMVDIEYNKI